MLILHEWSDACEMERNGLASESFQSFCLYNDQSFVDGFGLYSKSQKHLEIHSALDRFHAPLFNSIDSLV
jgi:hypothetical protein